MSYWVCCNSCFLSPSSDRKLAVSTCGHVVCHVCYQKGNEGKCLICDARCQVSPLTDKSSSEVKALFTDIRVVATKQLTEVIMFQARHQKRLLTHYQKKSEKLEEVLLKMKQEMQQMSKKLNEQNAHISELECSLQHQSAKTSSMSQMSHRFHTPPGQKPVFQIQYNPPLSLSGLSSTTNLAKNMEANKQNVFRKPNAAPRISLVSPPQDGRKAMCLGTVLHRPSNVNILTNHSTRSATASHVQKAPMTPNSSSAQSFECESPIFKPSQSFRRSMSSLVCPPP